MTKVAVVILNWNGVDHLKRFLPSVEKHTQISDVKIIIADNNSSDNSVEFIATNYPDIVIIQLDQNYGFAGGYNRSLKQVEAEYYVLLNSDIEVTANWLQPLIDLMDSNDKIGACQPKIHAYNNKAKFEYAGAAGGYIDKFGYPFCRGRILSEIEHDTGQYDTSCRIFWATGACLMVRANLFHELKGLDPNFFAHMEEIDLCWRIQNLGYKIYCEPKALVYHVGGGTLPNNNPRKLYLNYRNSLFMLFKNLPAQKLIPTLFLRLLLDGASGSIYLLSRRFSFLKAVLAAHLSFYLKLPGLLKQRKINNPPRSFPATVYSKSILKQFFIAKNRTYSSIEKSNLEGIC
jgi:GT2 family glycosyltransferase